MEIVSGVRSCLVPEGVSAFSILQLSSLGVMELAEMLSVLLLRLTDIVGVEKKKKRNPARIASSFDHIKGIYYGCRTIRDGY